VNLGLKIEYKALSNTCIVMLHFDNIGPMLLIVRLKTLNMRELQSLPEVHQTAFATDGSVIQEE